MAQQTNLNVSPYFDDFDPNDNYHKVLFKPGYPVQARELTGLQSILQNQIEKFGQHFFKEGAKVIPGNTAYSSEYYAVELNNSHLGVPVEFYIDQIIDRKIIGATTGVTAIVKQVLRSDNSDNGNLTLYISYMSSGVEDSTIKVFADGELLLADSDITSGPQNNAFIPSGESFASCIANNATSTAASFSISNGVYFIRGNFVQVQDETILLSQYENKPSARVGLRIDEDIINADEDETLADNSKGFNNYAAPGADRLKISVSLFAKPLDDFNDSNFVELAVIDNGILRSQVKNTQYSFIRDELARRTYAESGDYVVKNFSVSLKDSLNDNVGNNGVYEEGQFTQGGTLANDDLAVYQVSPGKAFVKGYEVETISSTYIDAPKPRTSKRLEGQGVAYKTGNAVRMNNVQGAPEIGIGNTYIVSLRDGRIGAALTSAGGSEIGVARVYDFALESGSYSTTNNATNEWDLSLYDIQLFSKITLNEPVTFSIPTEVKGKYSGATGFLRSAVSNSTSLEVYEKSGEFLANEPFIINGKPNNRVAVAVTAFGMQDVKSVYGGPDLGDVGFVRPFNGDVIQRPVADFGNAAITGVNGTTGISTVTSESALFPGTLKVGNILSFGGLGNSVPTFARITEVNTNNVKITGVTTVSGVVSGQLPSVNSSNTPTQVSSLRLQTSPLERSSETQLYALMPKAFISDVDLTDSTLTIRKKFDVDVSINPNNGLGQLSAEVVAGTNESFLPFDEERYIFMKADGSTVPLRDNMFRFSAGNTILQIRGLGAAATGCVLITTLKKTKPTAKIKKLDRVNSIVVNYSDNSASGIGATTLNDGLNIGNFPIGTRVQDKKIVLNNADIVKIHGIFESHNTAEATAPKMTLTSLNGPSGKTTDLVIGELVIGQESGAVAVVAESVTDAQITYITQNETAFEEGEIVDFKESNIQGLITTLDNPSKNISSNYTFNTGQRGTFYDYGFITRKTNAKAPKKQLKIYFMNGFYESTDEGDITVRNSYSSWNYSKEIPMINNEYVTDTIDIRPKVDTYTVLQNVRSPLEFFGRSFTTTGGSAKNILASDETITVNFSHFVGRVDRIFLDQTGRFQVKYGDPSEKRERPTGIDDAIELASIILPPYLFQPRQARIDFLKYKRYRMKDIKDLEDRIKNLEYYTSLSLLETQTSQMFVPDADGLNKFKSGFFVDNFTTLKAQETNGFKIKNSLDPNQNEMRPQHYCTSLDLQPGPVENVPAGTDLAFLNVEGTNVIKQNDVVTLAYTEVEWLSQQFATRTESVTPFLVSFWQATVKLSPQSDTWTDTARLDAKIIQQEGNFAGVMAQAMQEFGVDPQTGLSPIQWNAWETTWTGKEFDDRKEQRKEVTGTSTEEEIIKAGWINGGSGVNHSQMVTTTTTTTFEDTVRDTYKLQDQVRSGTRKFVTEQFDNESIGDRVVSRDVITNMRSRNIEFRVTKCKPLTELYAFFDGVSVNKYCTPKLLEITMESGTFKVGETVVGSMPGAGVPSEGTDKPAIRFRVAQANHRAGPYNSPTEVFAKNPYISQVGATGLETFLGTPGTVQLASTSGGATDMPATYSSTSTILNVDTKSLSDQPQGDFFGYIKGGMELRGLSSGATAEVRARRLISDLGANLIGSFYIPNPNSGNHPKFETGTKTFTMIDNNTNDQENTDTFGEDTYTAAGTLETVQENIISTRNAVIQTRHTKDERSTRQLTGSSVIKTEAISSKDQVTGVDNVWYDPLAQSFQVTELGGIFVTSCDVYFQTKDDMDIPMTFQLRTMEGGVPTQKILPFSEIIKAPDQIQVSQNGTVATRFNFEAPVYLEGGGTEYAICLASWSTKYKVFISRIGESDLLTDEFISQQPYLGSLFKSQNASTWDASQWEDLKFVINKAVFETSGTMEVYNPILSEGNNQEAKLQPNSININSKQIRVGIGTSLADNVLTLGNTINQLAVSDGTTDFSASSNASGNFVGSAGIGTGSMGIANAGLGYSPASGTGLHVGVALTNITAGGDFMTADVVVTDGGISSARIISSGSGFQQGDVLGITTLGNSNDSGRNARLSVVSIGRTDELILDNVQGDFALNGLLTYTHPITGLTTTLNTTTYGGLGSCRAEKITETSDGLHFTVDHRNHGMHHEQNRVHISGVDSDVAPAKLTLTVGKNSTSSISINNTDDFTTFENVAVGATNPGLIQIGAEVIRYTGVSGGSLTGITRGEGKSKHKKGKPVRKYELGGVSLARINRTHLLSEVTDRDPNPITFDSYTIKLNTAALTSTERTALAVAEPVSERQSDASAASNPKLFFNDTKTTGGYVARATQNIPFQIISPNVGHVTVPGTSVTAAIKTISASNLGDGMGQGTDLPFLEAGSEPVTLNKSNYLTSPRMVASRVNELNNSVTSGSPGQRSLNMTLTLESSDPNLSPVIDLQRMSAVFVSNRVDAPITNYKQDPRVNTLLDDPTSCQYVSRENSLANSASSIKILLDAHINEYSDIRAYYAISATPNFDPIFEPFPGYLNLNNEGLVISAAESDGRPDRLLPKSDVGGFKSSELTFREHEFNMENLPPFKYYRIKFLLTSTNQVYVPRVSNLRVITLA